MNDLLDSVSPAPRVQSSRRHGDIEKGPQRSGEIGLKYFFEKVEEVEEPYERLSALLKKLQDAHEETKVVTRASEMKGIGWRRTLTKLEESPVLSNPKSRSLTETRTPGCGQGSGVDRTRTLTTVALKKFKDRMFEFQTLKVNIQQEHREVVERRVFTVTGAKPDEELIDKLIETGDSEQIFQKAIQEQGRGQVIDTLAEIQERHDAVKDLGKKLMDLHQIFLVRRYLWRLKGTC